MSSKEDQILEVLTGDLLPLEDILYCMVAKKGMEGVLPQSDKLKQEIMAIWEALKNTMDELFDVIQHYGEYGLDKIYFELGNYDVMFFIIPGSDTALVAIVPNSANRGFLMIELDRAREKIIKVIEKN